MKMPILIIKDTLQNREMPQSVKVMPLAGNDNNRQNRYKTLERLTKDINQQLLRELQGRMKSLLGCTNFTAEELASANVKAIGRFYIGAIQMIESPTTRRKIIDEFDMLTNHFLK